MLSKLASSWLNSFWKFWWIHCIHVAVERDWESRRESEEVLREWAGEEIPDYYQVTKEWINHQEKICLQGATGAKLWITSLNSHFTPQEPQHQMLRRKKSGARDSVFSKFKPRYCGLFSRGKVWIKVCNLNFRENGRRVYILATWSGLSYYSLSTQKTWA